MLSPAGRGSGAFFGQFASRIPLRNRFVHFLFVKIVYDGGAACTAGSESCLWGLYTVVEEVYNDPHGGSHGNDRSKLVNPAGLGLYK
jgi:hypothetical protein